MSSLTRGTVKVDIRRDSASNFTNTNPTLKAGEPAFETDTKKLKVGDGSTAWTSLAYVTDVSLPLSGGAMTGAITTNSTFDGVDVATRDGVLSATTINADAALIYGMAALPKAGGSMTGHITMADDVRVTFGDAGEYIVGNGTDLDVVSSGEMNFSAPNADLGITSGRDLNIVTPRNVNANLAGNLNIDVDGGEARLTDDSETDNVFTPSHDADIATKKYVDDNGLKTVVVTLSGAQCTALHITPITLVAAQGSNKITLVQDVVLFIDRAATQTSAFCDLFVSYAGSTSLSGSIIKYKRRFMYGVTTDMVMQLGEYSNIIATSLTGGDNQKVAIKVDAAITSGCINSIKCVVKYYVYDNS
tara:strand:- start:142 stop:1221 length:1080 start_codon:yes stop_codon:yes gene_type:complete